MNQPKESNAVVWGVVVAALVLFTFVMIFTQFSGREAQFQERAEEQSVKSRVGQSKSTEIGANELKMDVPGFKFPSAHGGELGLDDLKGKIWVAEFMFTNCAGYCPEMSKQTELLQERTQDLPDLHFVSFTVDPERDTIEALQEYGAEYKADTQRWHFLRAQLKDVHQLGREGFKLLNDTDALMHSKKVALVDREGRIRGFFDGAGPERVTDFKALEAMIRQIYNETSN